MPRMIAYVLAIIGTSLMPPFITALIYGEQRSIIAFVVPMAVSWVVAFAFWMHRHVDRRQLGVYDAFALVGSVWISICLFGSLPLYLCGNFASFTDAVFESVSGFTTTGASIVLDVESLPRSINLWRCMTHWLGGMGVIALVVAIMPLLGIGGFKLFKAEMTGPDKFKVASRISTNAKVLWFIYFGMTFLQTALLRYSGMDWFDSACHSFSMVGSGGFSTRNASIGAFNNVAAEWICVVFMFLAGVNYSLYFQLFVGKVGDLFRDSELRAYFSIVILAIAAVTVLELRQFGSFAEAVRNSAFQVSALISTTGFITSDYANWVPGAQMILLTLFIVGGCSGSTAGGVKVVRWVVLGKQLANEISRLLHPHGIFTIRINGMPGRDGIVPIVAAFVFVYALMVILTAIIGSFCGLGLIESITGALSMVGNVGPAFGGLGPHSSYASLPVFLKWWYSFAMLAGRLEIYTVLILIRVFFHRKENSPYNA